MSDRSENRFELRRDGLGVLLFTAGAFCAVLIALALASSEPLDKAEGTAAFARIFAKSIGLVPGLLLGAGCAVVGARLFLAGEADVPRSTGRLAIVAFSLSVMLGAFSKTAGGVVGDLTAGVIARATNTFLGALCGLAVLAVGVWIAWVKRGKSAETSTARTSGEGAVAAPDHGVSAEEAAALIPEDLPPLRTEPRMDSPVTRAPSLATPLHREDVRRRGEIPEGTRPLDPTHVHASVTPGPVGLVADELAAPSLHHGSPDPEGPLAADGLDEDLAFAEELEDLDADEPEQLVELTERTGLTGPVASEPELELIEEDDLEIEVASELEEPETEPEPTASPPRPSWEQSSLFEVEEEPPVDAYGTPLVEPLVEEEEPGRDVILTPAPPRKKRKKARAPEVVDQRSRLLAEIGCLLLERGRVAVSMLQKQYDMDFEEATRVLDELQALGLIGPYLGGQRRDILLTRDEWLEKVSSL